MSSDGPGGRPFRLSLFVLSHPGCPGVDLGFQGRRETGPCLRRPDRPRPQRCHKDPNLGAIVTDILYPSSSSRGCPSLLDCVGPYTTVTVPTPPGKPVSLVFSATDRLVPGLLVSVVGRARTGGRRDS